MPYTPISQLDEIETGVDYRSWFVVRGAGFNLDRVKNLASSIISLGARFVNLKVKKVRWYSPEEVDNGALYFEVPATAKVGQWKPWAIRVDWMKIETPPRGPGDALDLRRTVLSSPVHVVVLVIAAAFLAVAGLAIALKFTEKSVVNVAQKTFPWALAGLAGIALIVMRRRFA